MPFMQKEGRSYDKMHISTEYEEKFKLFMVYMEGKPRQCFTMPMLESMLGCVEDLKRNNKEDVKKDIRYIVSASEVDGIYNLGGDLNLFHQLIEAGDSKGLLQYGETCIKLIYSGITHFGLDVDNIALVQGDALGGGFEGALAANVIIAERGCAMGCPEILFNLFPGMGAFHLLSARAGSIIAKQVILSGQRYLAEDLYKMGIIDILAEKGGGKDALYDYIKRAQRVPNGYSAMRQISNRYNTISYKELMWVVELWVQSALSLTKRDLKLMRRLICRQG